MTTLQMTISVRATPRRLIYGDDTGIAAYGSAE